MVSENWKNKWVITLMLGIIIQVMFYSLIWVLQPTEFTAHPYFFDVMIICAASVVIQSVGFGVIMKKTNGQDPAIYGQGRPFRHKLREEDIEEATRKPTYAK